MEKQNVSDGDAKELPDRGEEDAASAPGTGEGPAKPEPGPQPVPASVNHAPALVGSNIQRRLAASGDYFTQEAAKRPEVQQLIQEFEARRAEAGANRLRYYWESGRLIQQIWEAVPFPEKNSAILRDLRPAAQSLGISTQQAAICVMFSTMCDEEHLEKFVNMGITFPVVESLLKINNPADRGAALKAVREGKWGAAELALYVKRRVTQETRERNKLLKAREREQPRPVSPRDIRQWGENAVNLCRGTLDLVAHLTGALDSVVAQMTRFRQDWVHVSYEHRVEVCREVVAGLEAAYALQFIMAGFIETVAKKIPPPAPKQLIISPADQPPYNRLHEVWDYLLMDGELLVLTDASVRGIGVASRSGKNVQFLAQEMLTHIRKLKGRLEWAENLHDDGGVPPVAEVRANVFEGLRWACDAMTAVPGKLNHTMAAILPKGSGPQQAAPAK